MNEKQILFTGRILGDKGCSYNEVPLYYEITPQFLLFVGLGRHPIEMQIKSRLIGF